jgi:hypothetical protein
MSANQIAPINANPLATTAGGSRERLAFVPKDFDDAWRQADVLSKVGIFPDYLKGKPHDILATIITGAELGLSPMQSVRDIVVVKGKGFIQSKLKVALVKQSLNKAAGDYFRMVESSATKAVYETKRDGHVTKYEYTIEMAKLAGMLGNDNYQKRPAEMLRARCSGDLCEIEWSDVTRGIGIKEDIETAETPLNKVPTTFAPPAPEIEEAQVVAPTPPAPPAAKVEQPVVEARKPREPGDDDDAPPASEAPKQQTLAVEAPSELAVYAEVNAVDVNDPDAEKKLDDISPRARAVQGPSRKEISDMMIAKRAAIRTKRAGK